MVNIRVIVANTIIIQEGENIGEIGFISKGKCLVTKKFIGVDPLTNERIVSRVKLGYLNQGDYFGELAAHVLEVNHHQSCKSPYTVKTMNECEIIFISAADGRMRANNILKLTSMTCIACDSKQLYSCHLKNKKEKAWIIYRKKVMDRLTKERFKDPNLDHASYLRRLNLRLPAIRFK